MDADELYELSSYRAKVADLKDVLAMASDIGPDSRAIIFNMFWGRQL